MGTRYRRRQPSISTVSRAGSLVRITGPPPGHRLVPIEDCAGRLPCDKTLFCTLPGDLLSQGQCRVLTRSKLLSHAETGMRR